LVPLAEGEPLLLYVIATDQVASVAIVVERKEEGHALSIQRPIYFISKVLFATTLSLTLSQWSRLSLRER
jgi:hypothetical protein